MYYLDFNENMFTLKSMIIFPDVTIITAHAIPNSLKHTPKYGEHRPINSPILLNEMANLFWDKATLREGEELKIDPIYITEDHIYIEFLSQTTSMITGNESQEYREIGCFLSSKGIACVNHYLPHKDTSRFEEKKKLLEEIPYSYIIRFNRKSLYNT